LRAAAPDRRPHTAPDLLPVAYPRSREHDEEPLQTSRIPTRARSNSANFLTHDIRMPAARVRLTVGRGYGDLELLGRTPEGKQQRKRDPGMKVDLDLSNAEDWDLLTRYAPWSINVDLYDHTDHLIANFHDCGHDVTARLSADQAARLSDDLGDLLHVETLKALRDRERDH
jgi:hypothetical protein